ncbi:hypothetical protein A3Q56_04824 [Intoshia linei]|uniref:CBM21 domain-containing protein n=1 Tax=Intoshia linei TaxID=1819745 RepID=A0A177AZL4_9BILA|nr:hypothetical protein A3Q56_04824 [Intoshia linei]
MIIIIGENKINVKQSNVCIFRRIVAYVFGVFFISLMADYTKPDNIFSFSQKNSNVNRIMIKYCVFWTLLPLIVYSVISKNFYLSMQCLGRTFYYLFTWIMAVSVIQLVNYFTKQCILFENRECIKFWSFDIGGHVAMLSFLSLSISHELYFISDSTGYHVKNNVSWMSKSLKEKMVYTLSEEQLTNSTSIMPSCIIRSTSLKRYNSKKKVKFADSVGLQLEKIQYLNLSLQSYGFQSNVKLKVSQIIDNSKRKLEFICLFLPSINHYKFVDNVRKFYLKLSSCLPDPNKLVITYIVAVNNISFEKKVFVRYSISNWKTYTDVYGKFQQHIKRDNIDYFGIITSIPHIYATCSNFIEFVIAVTINGQTYWDNNMGSNYKIIIKLNNTLDF